MAEVEHGAPASGTGSRPSDQAPAGLAAARVDPSREGEMSSLETATSFCGDCHTIDGCACPAPVKRPTRKRRSGERAAIVSFLRQGGERPNGVWYSWDSEMAGYAKSFADRIERGDHRK